MKGSIIWTLLLACCAVCHGQDDMNTTCNVSVMLPPACKCPFYMIICSNAKLSSCPDFSMSDFSVGFIFLNGNNLLSLNNYTFVNFTQLRNLDLHSNQLSTLPSDILNANSYLDLFNIAKNPLTSLPSDLFTYQTRITSIQISNTLLLTLPESMFFNNTRLQTL